MESTANSRREGLLSLHPRAFYVWHVGLNRQRLPASPTAPSVPLLHSDYLCLSLPSGKLSLPIISTRRASAEIFVSRRSSGRYNGPTFFFREKRKVCRLTVPTGADAPASALVHPRSQPPPRWAVGQFWAAYSVMYINNVLQARNRAIHAHKGWERRLMRVGSCWYAKLGREV